MVRSGRGEWKAREREYKFIQSIPEPRNNVDNDDEETNTEGGSKESSDEFEIEMDLVAEEVDGSGSDSSLSHL